MAFRSTASNTYVGAGGATVTAAVPAGAQTGDTAITWIWVANDGITASATGWTALDPVPYNSATSLHGAMLWLYKHLTAADTGSYTFTLSGSSGGHVAFTALFSGREIAGSPFDFTSVKLDTDVLQTALMTGTATQDADLVFAFSEYDGDVFTADGFTLRLSETTTGNNLFTADAATAGTVTAQSSATGGTSVFWSTFASLKVSSGGAPVNGAFTGAAATADAAAVTGAFTSSAVGGFTGTPAVGTAGAITGTFHGLTSGEFLGSAATATAAAVPGVMSRSVAAAFDGVTISVSAMTAPGFWDATEAVTGDAATGSAQAIGGRFTAAGFLSALTITKVLGPNLSNRATGANIQPDPKSTGPNRNGKATGPGTAYTITGAGV